MTPAQKIWRSQGKRCLPSPFLNSGHGVTVQAHAQAQCQPFSCVTDVCVCPRLPVFSASTFRAFSVLGACSPSLPHGWLSVLSFESHINEIHHSHLQSSFFQAVSHSGHTVGRLGERVPRGEP